MLNLQNTFVPSLLGCTVSGGACRFSFMAVFTVVVFLFVRYGHNGVVLRYVVLTVCVIWVINISLNAVVWSPQVITITIAKNVTCSPTLDDEGGLPFLIMYEGDGAEEALLEDIVLTAEGWLVFFHSFQPLFSFYYIFSHFVKRSASYVYTCKCSRERKKGSTTLSSSARSTL